MKHYIIFGILFAVLGFPLPGNAGSSQCTKPNIIAAINGVSPPSKAWLEAPFSRPISYKKTENYSNVVGKNNWFWFNVIGDGNDRARAKEAIKRRIQGYCYCNDITESSGVGFPYSGTHPNGLKCIGVNTSGFWIRDEFKKYPGTSTKYKKLPNGTWVPSMRTVAN